MRKIFNRAFPLLVVAIAMVAAIPPAGAQVVVTDDGQRVIVDGDTVRIEGPEGVTVVDTDWRGDVAVDTGSILVDLGAVAVDDRIQITLGESVLFDFGSSGIRADAAARLGQVAQVIRAHAVGTVYLLGHTDSVGDDAYNLELSRDRAAAVMSWLHHHEGIPRSIMVGTGMGSTRPVAHNTHPDGRDDPEGRAKNRRVEIQMATREGVTVGPGVVIAPGGVKVTSDRVVVAGGAVEVDESGVRVGGTAVQVDEDSVRVGGVEVTEEGVRVGGVSVGGAPAKDDVATDSAAGGGNKVERGCPFGDCRHVCRAGETCRFDCQGGDCATTCEEGSDCTVECSGGDCEDWCEPGATCDFRCAGGDCTFHCPEGADCRRVSCYGEDCVCEGAAC